MLGAALRASIAALRVLPAFVAYGCADVLTPVLVLATFVRRKRDTRHCRGFYYNTRIVFRHELAPRTRRRLLWRWARHMTHLGVDVCRMPRITADNLHRFCDVRDMQILVDYHRKGQGLLCASGHMGVYEYSSHIAALQGIDVLTIYRESPIPIVTEIINAIREAGGQRMTERAGAVRDVLRAARNGATTGIIADVSSKESEVFAPFLGTNAATNNTAGILHRKTDCPVLIVTTQRVGRRRFKFHVWDIVERQHTGDREADLRIVADRINAALGKAVTTYPEQWFWDSRRFRSRPVGEVPDSDDLPPRLDDGPARIMLQQLDPTR